MPRHALFIVLAAWLAGCVPHGSLPEEDATAQLDQRQAEFLAAQAARDAERMAALFADDAVLQVASMPPVEGREAIGEFYGRMFRFLSASRATAQRTEISAAGDMAWSAGTTTNEFSTADGTTEYAGKYALVWQRLDGEWRVVLYSISSDQRQ